MIDPETAPQTVADVIGVGSMESEAIVDELVRRESMRHVDAKLSVMRAIHAGAIEEHPDFVDCYRVSDPSV